MSNDTSRTITINIHSQKTDLIHLYYDTSPHHGITHKYTYHVVKLGTRFLHNIEKRWIFHIELKDLDPDKTYYFVIGDPINGYSEEKKFRTIPLKAKNFRFVEGGDFEVTSNAKEIAIKAAKMDPMAALFGGDYPRDANTFSDYQKWDEWLDVYEKHMVTTDGRMIPMVLAIGNHEVLGQFDQPSINAPFYYNYFPQSSKHRSYFYKYFGEKIVYIVLDSGHTASHSGPQKTWLEKTLFKNKNIPIKFASYHVPIFPSVRFPQKDQSYKLGERLMILCGKKERLDKLLCPETLNGRKHWLPLFDEYSLTCAFEHHDQTLKRTKFLRNGLENANGTLYLGDGGWGSYYQYTPIQAYFRSYLAKAIGHVHFFWLIDITDNEIHYKAITKNGNIIDECIQPYHLE